MLLAEISATAYYLSSILGLACAATAVSFAVGIVMACLRSSRTIGKRILFIALLCAALELGLLLALALVDVSESAADRKPNQAAAVNAPVASWFQFEHPWRRVTEQRRSA